MGGRIKFLVISIFLILFSVNLFAVDFTEADALIKERQFNAALLLLENMLRESPDAFDLIEKRITFIRKERQKYDKVAQELIKVIEENPLNTSRQFELIEKLRAIEPNPGPEEEAFIEKALDVAMFGTTRHEYNRIVEEGSALLAQNDYVGAVKKFEEAFELNMNEYDSRDFSPETRRKIAQNLEIIHTTIIPEYERLQKTLTEPVRKLQKAIEEEKFDEAEKIFPEVEREMKKLADLCNETAELGSLFYGIHQDILKEEPHYSPMSRVPILYKMTISDKPNTPIGIYGAMEKQWFDLSNQLKKVVVDRLETHWENTISSIDKDGLLTFLADQQRENITLSTNEELAALGKQVNKLHDLREFPLGTQPHYFQEFSTAMDAHTQLAEQFYNAIESGQRLVNEKAAIEIETTEENRTEKMQHFQDILQTSHDVNEKAADILEAIEDIDRNYTGKDVYEVDLDTTKIDDYVVSSTEQISNLAKDVANNSWNALSDFLVDSTNFYLGKYETILDVGKDLFDGYEEEGSGLILKFPAEALTEMNKILETAPHETEILDSALASSKTAPNQILRNDEYEEKLEQATSDIERLREIISEARDLQSQSRTAVAEAQREKRIGDDKYEQAKASLDRDRLTESRELIQESRTAYTTSLSIQHSDQLREESDTKLSALSVLVTDRENAIVVHDVRDLYNQAVNEYRVSNYEDAEQLLLQARDRWNTTNSIPNTEVEYLLQLVGRALSMKVGRSVPSTAPLYPEMSQLLNIAVNNYRKGKKLADSQKLEEARPFFAVSNEKIEEIRLVFPNHQVASLLSLRIQQLESPEEFNRNFEEWVTRSAENYKIEGRTESTYILLLDLAEINPDYPGLKQLIYDIEIFMGIRKRPPDRTAFNRSAELTRLAAPAADSLNEMEIRIALSRLEEALDLNPDNTEAAALKDRLQIKIGGQSVAVLSAESEAIYQQAILALQNNNIIEATAILNRLLQNSDTRLSTKVQQLADRIKILTN